MTTLLAFPSWARAAVDRTAITSYNRMAPGAPYHGYFASAWQSFVASSDTITTLGVTVGTPGYTPDGHTVTIRLCTDPTCSTKLAEASPQIANYGNTQVDVGDVAVTVGQIYYLVWYQPASWNGQTWVTYWWAGGSTISQSDQMQAIVQGYDRTTSALPTYHVFGTASLGLKERSGPGLSYPYRAILPEGSSIQIACQVRSGSAVGGSTVWDQLSDGTYVSDFYTDTPVYNGFSPGIGQCGTSPPPPAVNTSYHVYQTGGLGLKKRTGPGTNYPYDGALPDGATVAIACQWRSSSRVNGSAIWDELGDGRWIADGFVDTPAADQFTAGIPQCSSAPPPPAYEYPVPQSYGRPGQTPLGDNPTSVAADPVNTLTGAYWTQDTDLKLPGIGVPFQLERSYTSANAASGPLGAGWTQSYDMSLAFNDKGDVTLISDQGAQLAFELESTGLFVGAPGVDAQLRQSATGYELVRHDQTHFSFDTAGHLQAILDRNGQGLHLAHDASAQLTSITDSAGRVINFNYDPATHLRTSVTLPDGRKVTYRYTGGLLTSVTDPLGEVTSYSYDSVGRLVKVIDANGHTRVTNTYGSDGRVNAQTDALGNTSSFTWDAATQTSTMTDARGGVWKDQYTNNVLTSRTDADGFTTTYAYDGDLNLIAVTDPRGNVSGATAGSYTTRYTYDERGNRLSETAPAPLGYVKSWTYDSLNDVTGETDARGSTTSYSYDAAGNLILEIRHLGSQNIITAYDRDPTTGLVLAQSDPDNNITRFTYDSAGNRTSITTPLGETTTISYDGSGRMTSRTDPRGNVPGADPARYTTRFTYDGVDRLTMTIDPLGQPTTTGYDAVGNKTAVVDANLHTTRYAYDAADHLTSVVSPVGATTTYQYDPSGNLTARTDANGHAASYAYDPANHLASIRDPLGRTTAYSYDPAGNLITTVDAKGTVTSNSYDALNRRTGTTYSDGTPAVSFTYDADGNRTAMTDAAGTQTAAFDTLNRLTQVTRGTGTFSYSYDSASHVISRTYPGSSAMTYAYDKDGRQASVTANGGTTTYAYDAAGNETSIALPSGYTETKAYDAAGRITRVATSRGTSNLTSYTYTREAVGNPTTITGTGGTFTYTYDEANRLVKVCFTTTCTAAGSFIQWTYDGVGNRLTEKRSSTSTTSYRYDAADELLSATNGTTVTSYAYDADGNQTRAGTRTISYDATNHITSTTVSGGTPTTFTYDGDGNRVRQTAGTTVTNYAWDTNNALPQLVLELNGSSGLLRRYTYGNSILAESTPSATYYLTGDALGSITGITSSTGTPLIKYVYEPFGKTKTTTNLATTGLPSSEPMRFTGQFLDSLGRYDLRAREYDPTTGRFTAADPAPASTTAPYLASYVYAADRPTLAVDPSGASFTTVFIWLVDKIAGPYASGKDINDPVTSALNGDERTYNQCGWVGDPASLIPIVGTFIGYGCAPTQGVSDAEEQQLRQQQQVQRQGTSSQRSGRPAK